MQPEFLDLLNRIVPHLGPPGSVGIFSFILSLIFGSLFAYFTRKIFQLNNNYYGSREPISIKKSEPDSIRVRWDEILRHIASAKEYEWKFAVIEADKLVEDMLSQAGFAGETMGDKLMNIDSSRLASIESLWEAHKVRNRIVHDNNYFLRDTEARRIVELYGRTLKELAAIG